MRYATQKTEFFSVLSMQALSQLSEKNLDKCQEGRVYNYQCFMHALT